MFGVAHVRQNDHRREKKTHIFLQPPGQVPLHVRLATQPGKNGVGTIAEAGLDPELLRYLQTCPSWNSLAEKRLKTGTTMSKCVAAREAKLRLKTEIVGIVDEKKLRRPVASTRTRNCS